MGSGLHPKHASFFFFLCLFVVVFLLLKHESGNEEKSKENNHGENVCLVVVRLHFWVKYVDFALHFDFMSICATFHTKKSKVF